MSYERIAWLMGALVAATLAGCTAKSAAPAGGPPAAPVKVATASLKTVPVEILSTGTVEAYLTISVKAQVTGVLTAVRFHEGDAVRAGQLLFEIDARPYEEAVRQAEANLTRDRAALNQAEANLGRDLAQQKLADVQAKRYDQLAKDGIFTREQADQMATDAQAKSEAARADRAAIEVAQASIKSDQAALDRAKVDLSYCKITSPVDGQTGNLSVKQGNVVKATDVELVTIRQVQPVLVNFTVPERYVSAVRAAMAANRLPVQAGVKGGGSPSGEGVLSFIDNSVDGTTGTIRLKATFPNAKTEFWPGQFLDVRLRLSQRPNTVVIPVAALQTGQAGNFVYVVKQDGSVELRPVKSGARSGDDVAIESGLAAGEQVVTDGQLRLAPGSKVRVLS